MDEHDDLVVALSPFVDLLDRLGVVWYVGGSVASTVHGQFRATNDIDVVVELRAEHAHEIQSALGADHYVDEESIVDACRRRSSFNLVHFGTGLKIDVFVVPDSEYAAVARERRVRAPVGDERSARPIWIASAEDTVLAKLDWFRRGGEVSERQWRDVQGVLRLSSDALDLAYLHRWALVLGVADLLTRALAETDDPSG